LVLQNPRALLFFLLIFGIGLSSGVIENFAYIRIQQVDTTFTFCLFQIFFGFVWIWIMNFLFRLELLEGNWEFYALSAAFRACRSFGTQVLRFTLFFAPFPSFLPFLSFFSSMKLFLLLSHFLFNFPSQIDKIRISEIGKSFSFSLFILFAISFFNFFPFFVKIFPQISSFGVAAFLAF